MKHCYCHLILLLALQQANSFLIPSQRTTMRQHDTDQRVPFVDTRLLKDVKESSQNEDEIEYQQKLAKAEFAIAAAEEARRKLISKRRDLPVNSRATMTLSDAGTLLLELPSSGLDAQSVMAGAFGLAWFSVVVPATLSGAGLFMLPFWAAGGLVAKSAVVDPFVATQLSIGQYAWSLKKSYAGQSVKEKDGPTEELRGAIVEMYAVVNGVPQYGLKLYGDKEVIGFGTGLPEAELQYLADEINEHLRKLRNMPALEAPI